MDYKDTLNLPKTDFPMRAGLAQSEPQRINRWDDLRIYDKLLEKGQKNGKKFVLHDGPPYANGDAHVGHMTNHNLKDMVVRYKSMQGYETPFHPGWDCHGLPIELKAMKELKDNGKDLSALDVRKLCKKFAARNIDNLRTQFKRQGVLADWEKEYVTMRPEYEAEELRAIAAFVEKGLIYRDRKPIVWSIAAASPLAEAEIEYKEHTSTSIWVPFFRKDDPTTAFVIWTTTPWTLPANVAVALNANLSYVEVLHTGKKYIVAEALYGKFVESAGWEDAQRGNVSKGAEYADVLLKHPFMAHDSRMVMADYVSAEDGTGCVHTAPGHGVDDYMTGRANDLEIYSPIDDSGCYVDDGRIPAELVGLTTLEKKGTSAANEGVMAILERNGDLIASKPIAHSYPFCGRTKTPIIFRSVEQWFVGLDKNGMREKVLEQIDKVEWVPAQGRNRIRSTVEGRTDWCISRQRAWGVPIPAFFDKSGKRYIDAGVVRALADKVAKDEGGTDIFFAKSAAELLEGIDLPEGWNPAELTPEHDTIDVWFDSATSQIVKLKNELGFPCDLYLEGSDQHRGWFQSSIWLGVVVEGAAPYKRVLTHEFILDTNKEKLSKSRGSKPALEYINNYGADVMRLWNASQDYAREITLSEEILKQVSNIYRTIRNTLRFELANLEGFNPETDSVEIEKLMPLDKWALNELVKLIDAVTKAYDAYEFNRAYNLLTRFCQQTLSAVYHDCLKDRLYTQGADTFERRSAQTVIKAIFESLVKMFAPILSFTADEAWCFAPWNIGSAEACVHLENWPTVDERWKTISSEAADVEELMKFKALANDQLEQLRSAKTIGQSLEGSLTFQGKDVELLKKYVDALPEIFIVSQVHIEQADGEITVLADRAKGHKCPRCWRYTAQNEGEICERCAGVVKQKISHG